MNLFMLVYFINKMKYFRLTFILVIIGYLPVEAQFSKVSIRNSEHSEKETSCKTTIKEIHFIGSIIPQNQLGLPKKIINEVENENDYDKKFERYIAKKLKLKLESLKNHLPVGEEKSSLTVTPIVGASFSANDFVGPYPLDNSMAISNGGTIISVTNTIIEYYNTSGTCLYTSTFLNFFSSVSSLSMIYDPKVLYDPASDRFIFVALNGTSSSTSKVLVCFSMTNNPQNGWWIYAFNGNQLNNSCWLDYPNLGISNNEVYITGNLFQDGSGVPNQSIVFALNKNTGYNGGTFTGTTSALWYNISGSPFTLVPISFGQDGNYGPGVYLVSNNRQSGSNIDLYDLTDDIPNSPSLNHYSISTMAYSAAANSPQLNYTTNLVTGDCRIRNGFYLNGIIHFVFASDIGSGWCGINYNRLNVSTLTNTSSTFGFSGSFDCSYPSVASFATTSTDKSVMIGFCRTGPSIYPEIRVVNCDDAMSWSSSTIVHLGISYCDLIDANWGAVRWGDYTGISRMHSSASASIWMGASYANALHKWDTWLAEVHGSTSNPFGSVSASILPSAVTSLATWSLDGGGSYASGYVLQNVSAGSHSVSYNNVNGWISPSTQNITVVSGNTANTTGTYIQNSITGAVNVTMLPTTVSTIATWNIDGFGNYSSGFTLNSVVSGNHIIGFSNVAGWISPISQNVTVIQSNTTNLSGTYSQNSTYGSLNVVIHPQAAVNAGATWNLDGLGSFASGILFNPVLSGLHTIGFNSVFGWVTPINQSTNISSNNTSYIEGTYIGNSGIEPNLVDTSSNILIYPNPTNDILTVEFHFPFHYLFGNISIYDIQGELMLESLYNKKDNEIDISKLASGLYFVKISNQKVMIIKKFIKD
ncbi:MAG: T9SS type A sorting domain-containing protein [Bacteroidetes bacterium]|nr:T9SS type A sorting domain-containing protein [Bacteroidota bacterium]